MSDIGLGQGDQIRLSAECLRNAGYLTVINLVGRELCVLESIYVPDSENQLTHKMKLCNRHLETVRLAVY